MGHIHHEHDHHTHDHGEHPHDHHHVHTHDHSDSSEVKALLEYMINHNAHHAEELANLMDSLPPQAQKKLSIAIGSFEAANVELQMVLDCLK